MKTPEINSKCLLAVLAMTAAWAPAGAEPVTTEVDPPALEDITDTTNIVVIDPSNTMQGTRGLSQTFSAEALGQGRLVFGVHGPWYRQERAFEGAPNKEADIFSGVGTIAYGISPYWDIFASLSAYGSNNYDTEDGSGLGTVGGGIQGTLPVPRFAPLRVGGQFAVLNGISDNPIDSNQANGYNYFETRTGMDFRGSLLQTIVLGKEDGGFKLHFNEGVVTSMEDGREPLLLLGTGMQFNMPIAVLGVELHSRTDLNDVAFAHDPLWVTPSMQLRTGYNVNLTGGVDISLSEEAEGPSRQRALEPYRIFGGLALTFDTQKERRRQEKMKAFAASQEKARLQAENLALASQASAGSDSALLEKARQDSLALEEANRLLAEQEARTLEMERQLLDSGMLVLDAVYFETDKAEISVNSEPYLDMLAKMLIKYPKLKLEVAGHTDNVGNETYNQGLSQRRADAVRAHLVREVPALDTMLTAKGYGESRPKADNSTEEGRLFNRRTELDVLNKDALKEYARPEEQARGPSEEEDPTVETE